MSRGVRYHNWPTSDDTLCGCPATISVIDIWSIYAVVVPRWSAWKLNNIDI